MFRSIQELKLIFQNTSLLKCNIKTVGFRKIRWKQIKIKDKAKNKRCNENEIGGIIAVQ